MFDLYLLDLDGTLVDMRRDIAEAVNHIPQLHAQPVVGSSDADLRKPNPSNLLSLVRDIGTSKERTLMVGDSRNDILVAHNAGVNSCGCTFGYIGRDALLELDPTYLIETWPGLLLLADPAN